MSKDWRIKNIFMKLAKYVAEMQNTELRLQSEFSGTEDSWWERVGESWRRLRSSIVVALKQLSKNEKKLKIFQDVNILVMTTEVSITNL